MIDFSYFSGMKKIFLCLAVACLAFVPLEEKQYCNSRFQFCVDYPGNFKGQGESGSGDGQVFISSDKKAKITVYGMMRADEEVQSLDISFKEDVARLKVAYKLKKENYYILSGTNKKGNIVYLKTALKKIALLGEEEADTEVFQTVEIEYPASQQAQYASYCAYIAKSLQ